MFESNQTAIVTGGNSGIGEAIVHLLAKRGMDVVVAGRRQDKNEQVAREVFARHGVEALPVQADVSQEEDCQRLIDQTLDRFQSLHLLINNAGTSGGGKIAELESESFDRVMRTNLYSAFWCSKAAYRAILANNPATDHGLRGGIIDISSVCGVDAWAGVGAYCASKHGMMGLTRAMADEGKRDRIRVVAICPAMVSTPMTGVSGPEYIAPDDISATVAYLLDLTSAAWPTEIVINRRGAD